MTNACEDLIRTWKIDDFLPQEFLEIMKELDAAVAERTWFFDRAGCCSLIPL